MDCVDGRRGFVGAAVTDFAAKAQEAHDKLVEEEKSPCIFFDETSGKDLNKWLGDNRPDKVTSDQAAWIGVRRTDRIRLPDDMTRIDRRLDQVRQWPVSDIGWPKVKEVAQQLDYLSGSWMFYVSRGNVRKMWSQVAKLVWSEGHFDKVACEARVSTRQLQQADLKHVDYCVVVFNRDCTDYEQVTTVEKTLRDLGAIDRLFYKPEIYARLGVYSGNGHIVPTIYTSKYNRQSKQSNIESPQETDDQFP